MKTEESAKVALKEKNEYCDKKRKIIKQRCQYKIKKATGIFTH